MGSKITRAESTQLTTVAPLLRMLTMLSWQLVMALKMELNTGLSRIHGVKAGVIKATSISLEMSTCAPLVLATHTRFSTRAVSPPTRSCLDSLTDLSFKFLLFLLNSEAINHHCPTKGARLHLSIKEDRMTEIEDSDIAILAKIGDKLTEKLG